MKGEDFLIDSNVEMFRDNIANKAFHIAQLRNISPFGRSGAGCVGIRKTPFFQPQVCSSTFSSPEIQEGKLLRHTFHSAAAVKTLKLKLNF